MGPADLVLVERLVALQAWLLVAAGITTFLSVLLTWMAWSRTTRMIRNGGGRADVSALPAGPPADLAA